MKRGENMNKNMIAFDYETTGIKPHAKGHRIVCVSVADNENHVYVFMMPKTKRERQPFIDLLKNKRINKIAHNIKFEDTWSIVRLQNTKVARWSISWRAARAFKPDSSRDK